MSLEKAIVTADGGEHGQAADARVRVWDPLVRIMHWGLVFSVALAWWTCNGGGVLHEWAGNTTLMIVVLRIVWGWGGPPYARFRQFVREPAAIRHYARQLLARKAPRYVGHNPLGGWMILLLLIDVALTGLSGWLYTTDAYWGEQWLESVHNVLAWSLLALVTLHVTAVVGMSIHHAENLAGAMIHGRKRPGVGDDIA